MRSFTTAALALLAASTVGASPTPIDVGKGSPSPSVIYYEVSSFNVTWSLGDVTDTSFDLKEQNANTFIAHCAATATHSTSTPPDGEPLSGKCESKDPGSQLEFSVGGSPGQNFLIFVKDTMSIPCGPDKEYEANESFGETLYDCTRLEQNGNSANCLQKEGAVIELQMNKYYEGPPRELQARDAQGAPRC